VCAGLACSLTAPRPGLEEKESYCMHMMAPVLASLWPANKQVKEEEEEDDKAHG